MHITHLLPLNGKILICGPNWLGDSIMSMPAVQLVRRRCPECRLTMLVKPGMAPLWKMHPAFDEIMTIDMTVRGTMKTAAEVSARRFDGALVFPNSFRSALIPYLARIPVRVGAIGHGRAWMLTNVIRPPVRPERRHQIWEYMEIVGVASGAGPELPRLTVPPALVAVARERLKSAGKGQWAAMIPGAARGRSKQWPEENFIHVGKSLAAEKDCNVLLLGTRSEEALCRRVADSIGSKAMSLAGETSLAELAAYLSQCQVAIVNDSGGMHLASAVGTRVVAIFGITDETKTGPIGHGHKVLRAEGFPASRDVPRASATAEKALRSISPQSVLNAAKEVLGGYGHPGLKQ